MTSRLQEALQNADLLIEFTNPEATLLHAEAAAQAQVPLLIGTTGFSDEQLEKLKSFSSIVPIFWSPNMSLGIIIIRKTIVFLWDLYQKFGMNERTSIEIAETHHVRKKDRPSGTAKLLAQEVRLASGRSIPDDHIRVSREGDVIGVHRLTFDSGSERIILQHDATERRLFAQGALVMARNFMRAKGKPGWYAMDDFVK